MISNYLAVARYVSQITDLLAFVENLQEFIESMPATSDDNTLPGLNYGHLGDIGRIHEMARDIAEIINQYSEAN